jgi:large subunit ribosomal protein L23
MALFDFLKRKKEIEKAKEKKPAKAAAGKPVEKVEKVSAVKPEKKKVEKIDEGPSFAKASAKKSAVFSYEAVKQPHISEKASYLAEKNQYIFEISPNYNKKEIKKAVEGIYGVDVLSVNIIKIPAKKRRLGKTMGFRKQFVKAVVKIKEGQKIEIL